MNTPQGQVPEARCQACIDLHDSVYGSWAPNCPVHNYDGTIRATHIQNPTKIEHVANDVSKNGVKLNMSTQQQECGNTPYDEGPFALAQPVAPALTQGAAIAAGAPVVKESLTTDIAAGAVYAALPDDVIDYVKGSYAFLQSTAPDGYAEEVFRLPPSATRNQRSLQDALQSDKRGWHPAAARQDSGDGKRSGPDAGVSASHGQAPAQPAPEGEPFRTDAEIVEQTEELARYLLSWGFNHEPADSSTPMRDSTHPFAERSWKAACHIQEMLTMTDVENALAELDAGPTPSPQAAQQAPAGVCNGSGRYDSTGSPMCSACNGTGKQGGQHADR